MSAARFNFLASAPRGFADLLARELSACGAQDVRERTLQVAFSGSLECAYRACLWSRIANRVYPSAEPIIRLKNGHSISLI